MEEQNVEFTDDQKEVLVKNLKQLGQVNSQLYGWVEKDSLSYEMKGILPSLIESHFTKAAKLLNYESYLTEAKKERHAEIRQANQKIRKLEEQLGSSKSINGLSQQLRLLADKVREWWNKEGFYYISDDKFYFSSNGSLFLNFGFMLQRSSSWSDTPASDKKSKKSHIQSLRDLGFEFADFENDRYEKLDLIDNQNNRDLLTRMLKDRFPSLKIIKWDNRCSFADQNKFKIHHIKAAIYDLTDI